jgi:type II secretory pathway component PulF
MPTFVYKARNKQGERVEGKHEASDKRTALLALRESELFVTQLDPLSAAKPKKAMAQSGPESNGKWWWRANAKNMSLYFRQLQALLKSGTALAQALNAVAQSAPSKPLREASLEMARRTAKGDVWSEQMREYPGLFSPLALAMIRSGEAGGFLDVACGKLADYAEHDHHIQQVIARETWYPKMVIFAAIFILNIPPLVVAIMKGQPVGPAILGYLLGIALPLSVIFLVWLATNGKKFIMPLARHLRPLTIVIDQIKLLTPVVGKTVRNLAVAKFCRAFAALNAAGLGVATSFELAGEACGNTAIASRIREIIPQVEQGQGITDALAATRQFQPVVLQMMRTGEVSGNFDEQLNSVAEFMEQEGESSIRKSMVVLGILALLAVAVMVGYYVINFYVGYFNNIFNMAESMSQ